MSAISAGKLYVGKLAPNSAPIHGLMQHSPLQLRQKLIDTVDDKYNVKDMDAIVEVLGNLERLPVTKDILESTRLGKTVNEFRRKVNNDYLAKRAKALVKKWRETILLPEDSSHSSHQQQPQHFQPSRSHNGTAFADTLLREQIAQANREGHGRTTDEIVRDLEERSVQEKLEAAAKSAAATPSSSSKSKLQEHPRTKLQDSSRGGSGGGGDELKSSNEFVQSYLKSQSELRHQIEQQYLDSLSQNEFQVVESNHCSNSESLPGLSDCSRGSTGRKSKRAKVVDVSHSTPPPPAPSSSISNYSPAVPHPIPTNIAKTEATAAATTTTTTTTSSSQQQPPLTSPQSSFSSNKVHRKSKLRNNYNHHKEDDENDDDDTTTTSNHHQLLSQERDEIEPYYNNNNNHSTNSNINNNNNLISHGASGNSNSFLNELNDQSRDCDYSSSSRPGNKYLKSNSSDRLRSSSSSPSTGLQQFQESSLSPLVNSGTGILVSPPSSAASSSSSSTSSSTGTTKSTSRKKLKSHLNKGSAASEPAHSPRFDLISSEDQTDDNKKSFLFDEESQMESDMIFPTKSRTTAAITTPSGRLVDFSLFSVQEEMEEEEDVMMEDEDDGDDDEDDEKMDHRLRVIDVDTLHSEKVPNVNGNVDPSGQFHEWHETYIVPSTASGEPLHILPYCIIDF